MALGYSDLKNLIKMPGNWDLSYLKKYEMSDGTTFDAVALEVAGAITAFNSSLASGYWAQYIRPTTELTVEAPTGNATRMQAISEYSRLDPQRGETTGWMLPRYDKGTALGWTEKGLRRGRRAGIEADIRMAIEAAQNEWQISLMETLFRSTAVTVGSSGKAVPFADAGVADAGYIPPSYGGKTFAASHTHYFRKSDDAAGRLSFVTDGVTTLLEHGIMGPFDLIVPEADIADWAAVTGFKKPERGVLITAGVETRAQISEEEYIGIIEVDRGYVRIKQSPRLPTDYAGIFKPTGFGSPLTPLAVRFEEGQPQGLALKARINQYPLEDAQMEFTFGFGVQNRLAGAACRFAASGNYSTPTIS
jgi:hypothetical protein